MITSQILRLALLGAEWVLWVLVVLSVASIYVILERGIALVRVRGGLAALAGRAFRDGGGEALETALAAERLRLERGLGFLATVGSNAPFVGLLGTVIGVIAAFHDLSRSTGGGPERVMAGISEALVATAVGLFVAVPAVVAYNGYGRLLRRMLAAAEVSARSAGRAAGGG